MFLNVFLFELFLSFFIREYGLKGLDLKDFELELLFFILEYGSYFFVFISELLLIFLLVFTFFLGGSFFIFIFEYGLKVFCCCFWILEFFFIFFLLFILEYGLYSFFIGVVVIGTLVLDFGLGCLFFIFL